MVDRSIPSRGGRRTAGLPVTFPALALLVAGALAPAGCVSRTQYTQVEQERDLCTARYEQLRTRVEGADRAGETLAQEKTALATEKTNVAQDILFDSGSATLDTNGVEVLQRVAAQLRKSLHQIMVIGHTDNRPIGPALVKQYPTN